MPSVSNGGSRIFVDLGALFRDLERPKFWSMLSTSVAAVCSADWALVLLVRAALASAACRRVISCSISACWEAIVALTVDVSVVGVSTVWEFED